MEKINTIITGLLLMILISCNSSPTQIFVAPSGSDTTGTGSIDQPFASLERARDEIRSLNIFYKPGDRAVLIGGGHDNPYTNNIFIDAEIAIHVDNRSQQGWGKYIVEEGGLIDKRLKMVNYSQPPYSLRYPNLAKHWEDNPSLPKRNTVSKNVFYKVEKVVHGNKEWLPFKDDNWITDEDPGFVNEEEMNFELKEGAKVFEAIPGFEPIPFSKIGVQK